MPTTITAFYDFVPGAPARSSEVDHNFSNFRGHLIPVTPDTATSNDNTYDIGSDSHRWGSGFFGTGIRVGDTLSNDLFKVTSGHNATTSGQITYVIGGQERLRYFDNTGGGLQYFGFDRIFAGSFSSTDNGFNASYVNMSFKSSGNFKFYADANGTDGQYLKALSVVNGAIANNTIADNKLNVTPTRIPLTSGVMQIDASVYFGTLKKDTTTCAPTLSGMTNGIEGQRITFICTTSTAAISFLHNNPTSGGQGFYFEAASTYTLSGISTASFMYFAGAWRLD